MRTVKRCSPNIKALMVCAFAFSGVMLPIVSAHKAFAESEAAEADRIARFNKKAGIVAPLASGTGSHYQGGGGPATTATEVVASQNQIPMLSSTSDSALRAAQEKYASIASQGGFPQIPRGSYKNGSKGAAVGALNKHLFLEGYLRVEGTQGEFAQLYTNATEEAVSHFQRNMGLSATGKVDNATLSELNVSAEERLRTIAANIPRLAIYDKELGDRYLVVNVPAQQLETVSAGKVFSRHNVIVGRPERPSPVVMTALSTVKFNPYWNAPVSIVERDILPKMVSGTQVLTDMNMKVFEGGPNGREVDPDTVRFTPANIDKFLFRQEPGPHSAMATAKIEFPSTFGIYLHDTPEPQLFKTSNRFYSSGCIRVEKMPLLVEWVLNGQDGFSAPKISTMAETLERLDVPLATPPQLRVAYLTAWPTAGGTVAFRRDIYNMDSSGFTVGQPMPVGESSPDGLRYVLKPLPRQVSVDAAEAESSNFFSIFGKRSATIKTDKTSIATPPKKNIFGAKLASASSVSVDTPISTKKPKPGKDKKPFVGLFNWAAYKKDSSTVLMGNKKPKKLANKAKPSASGVIPPEPKIGALDAVPPEPTIPVKKKKKIVAANDVPPPKPAN
jgi:L,D-transpeptidase YcbB